MRPTQRPIAVYVSSGDVGAYLVYPYLFNLQGEWVGWVTANRDIFSVLGVYVGYLTDEPRILRKRTMDVEIPKRIPPPAPVDIYPPATSPLAPMLRGLGYDLIDVQEEYPEALHTRDAGELKQDMD